MAAGRKTGGRRPGSPNKIGKTVKTMALEALGAEGGVDYLRRQARENPASFMTMLAKIIPQQVGNDDEGPLKIIFERRIVK